MTLRKIGRYEIQDELGQGGMASVYLAHDPYIKRQVAIKVLSYHLSDKDLFQEYFQREAEAIAALEHPCIVPIFDFGRYGDQPYIVMRHMVGGSLAERLARDPLKPRRLAEIIERVAAALDAAHERDILHRDVKPSNILFDLAGEAFLTDFGLAKFLDRSTGLTAHMFVGTPDYMSPEQVRGDKLDRRSDVYALGVVVFRALTGRSPYRKERPMNVALAHVNDPVPKILEANPELPAMWEEITGKALAKDPRDRYATAGELARDVQYAASRRWYLRQLVDD